MSIKDACTEDVILDMFDKFTHDEAAPYGSPGDGKPVPIIIPSFMYYNFSLAMWLKAFDIDTRSAVVVATYEYEDRGHGVYSYFPEGVCPFYMEGKRYLMCGWKYVLWFEVQDGYHCLHFKRYNESDDLFEIGQQVSQYKMGSLQDFKNTLLQPVYEKEPINEHKYRAVHFKGGNLYKYGRIRTPWWVR